MTRNYPQISLSERRGLSVLETAAILSVGRSTVYNLLKTGKLKSTRICGRRVILRDSVENLLQSEAV